MESLVTSSIISVAEAPRTVEGESVVGRLESVVGVFESAVGELSVWESVLNWRPWDSNLGFDGDCIGATFFWLVRLIRETTTVARPMVITRVRASLPYGVLSLGMVGAKSVVRIGLRGTLTRVGLWPCERGMGCAMTERWMPTPAATGCIRRIKTTRKTKPEIKIRIKPQTETAWTPPMAPTMDLAEVVSETISLSVCIFS